MSRGVQHLGGLREAVSNIKKRLDRGVSSAVQVVWLDPPERKKAPTCWGFSSGGFLNEILGIDPCGGLAGVPVS